MFDALMCIVDTVKPSKTWKLLRQNKIIFCKNNWVESVFPIRILLRRIACICSLISYRIARNCTFQGRQKRIGRVEDC